jgi:hypothetical protein
MLTAAFLRALLNNGDVKQWRCQKTALSNNGAAEKRRCQTTAGEGALRLLLIRLGKVLILTINMALIWLKRLPDLKWISHASTENSKFESEGWFCQNLQKSTFKKMANCWIINLKREIIHISQGRVNPQLCGQPTEGQYMEDRPSLKLSCVYTLLSIIICIPEIIIHIIILRYPTWLSQQQQQQQQQLLLLIRTLEQKMCQAADLLHKMLPRRGPAQWFEPWHNYFFFFFFVLYRIVLGVFRSWHRIWAHYRTAMCITYFGMLYYSSFIWKNPVVRKCTEQILCPWWNWTIFQFLVLKKQKKPNFAEKNLKIPKNPI